MLALKGYYEDGKVVIPSPPRVQRRLTVVVTFLEELEESAPPRAIASKFSFAKSQELLKDFTVSLADAVVEERRNAL